MFQFELLLPIPILFGTGGLNFADQRLFKFAIQHGLTFALLAQLDHGSVHYPGAIFFHQVQHQGHFPRSLSVHDTEIGFQARVNNGVENIAAQHRITQVEHGVVDLLAASAFTLAKRGRKQSCFSQCLKVGVRAGAFKAQ